MLPVVHTLSFITCHVFFLYVTYKAHVNFSGLKREFSLWRFLLLILEVFFCISATEKMVAAFLQPGYPVPRCHALITCVVRQPCQSQSPFLGLRIFPDKVSLLDKAFVAHSESFFSNVALGFYMTASPFIWLAMDFSWSQLFHEKKKCSDGTQEQSLYHECVFF